MLYKGSEMEDLDRLNAEWIALSAFRGLTKIASQGDMRKSSYANALDLGGAVYPELLGDESILKRERESHTTKLYKEKAKLSSIRDAIDIEALELINKDIAEYQSLLSTAKQQKDKHQVEQLKRTLGQLQYSQSELTIEEHTETQLIFRDAQTVERLIPNIGSGRGHRDFKLPNDNVMRLRVLHPDKIEHITGADLIYEKHDPVEDKVTIVAVQYKIWDKEKLYLSEKRLCDQIQKMKSFLCDKSMCCASNDENTYRFPCCAAFIRPTDKLQKVPQSFHSSGEHLPICKIDDCKSEGERGAKILKYEDIREISLSNEIFEFLFNKGKIGSRTLNYEELAELYSAFIKNSSDVIIYAQEFQDRKVDFEQ